jgi:hypothetical protein
MIRRPIQNYFFFGTAVRYLQDARAGYRVCDYSDSWHVRTNLQQIFGYMKDLNLRVSSLTNAAGTLRDILSELQKCGDDDVLSAEQAKKLNDAIEKLRETLEAELQATYAYTVLPKRVDISRLIEKPASLFAPGVFEKLPEIAKYDIGEAARCIAFELPTAAAFHLMRTTEAVLRVFYVSVVRSGRRAKMWGEIVTDIRKRRVGKTHAVFLNHLDHLRNAFRNPTQHPDARYDIHEVQDLWSLAVDAINRMAPSL